MVTELKICRSLLYISLRALGLLSGITALTSVAYSSKFEIPTETNVKAKEAFGAYCSGEKATKQLTFHTLVRVPKLKGVLMDQAEKFETRYVDTARKLMTSNQPAVESASANHKKRHFSTHFDSSDGSWIFMSEQDLNNIRSQDPAYSRYSAHPFTNDATEILALIEENYTMIIPSEIQTKLFPIGESFPKRRRNERNLNRLQVQRRNRQCEKN